MTEWPQQWPGAQRATSLQTAAEVARAIPPQGGWFEPLPENRRRALTDFLGSKLRARMAQGPETEQIAQQLERLARGQRVHATQPWLSENTSGQPLEAAQMSRPVGGVTGTVAGRWRREFRGTKAGSKILAHPEIKARTPHLHHLTQSQVGQPRPPSFRDSARTETEMRQMFIEHLEQVIEHNDCRLVMVTDDRAHELIGAIFAQLTPTDWEHKKARWCINLKRQNAPVKAVAPKAKFPTGTAKMKTGVTPGDLLAGIDVRSAYKTVPQDEETGKKMRYPVATRDWAEARKRKGRPDLATVTGARVITLKGTRHYLLQPTALQFGGTLSRPQFEQRLQMPLSEMRRDYGARLITQVDDIALLSRHGPTALHTDLLVLIANLNYFRFPCHLTGEKAAGLWPKATLVFDGAEWHPSSMRMFSPVSRDERHRQSLREHLQKQREGRPMTLRRMAAVVPEQRSHAQTHWPTPLLLVRPQRLLAEETMRLCKGSTGSRLWEQVTRPFGPTETAGLTELLKPREVGEFLREPTLTILDAEAGSSNWGFGGIVTNRRTGERRIVKQPFTPTEQERAHTALEQTGSAKVAMIAMEQFPMEKAPSTIRPARVLAPSDNQATVRNWNRPKSRPSMVMPTIPAQIMARERGAKVVSSYLPKEYFDITTKIDEHGRQKITAAGLQLGPQLARAHLEQLGQKGPIIDCTASRANCQPQAVAFISRYPTGLGSGALRRAGVLTYNLRGDPELRGLSLCLNPPIALIPTLLNKIEEERATVCMTVPEFRSTTANWPQQFKKLTVKAVTTAAKDVKWINLSTQPVCGVVPNWPVTTAKLCGQERK